MEDWMSNLSEALTTVPLNQLAIPGSHDSGAYSLTTELAPYAPSALQSLAWIPGFTTLFGSILLATFTTQTLTIGQQLEHGIRHLDFRLAWWQNDSYLAHAVYGTKASIALEEMRVFLEKHPKEVVIMDLQQFHDIGPEEHTKLIAILKSTFGSKFLQTMDLKDVTLKYLWEKEKQIICIYQSAEASRDDILWSTSVIQSPWPNSPSAIKVINTLTAYMNDTKNVTDKFYVCQAVVTPDLNTVLKHLTPTTDNSIKTLTKALNTVLKPWLEDSPNHFERQPNVVIKDFVELDGYVQSVVDLNKYRILGHLWRQQQASGIDSAYYYTNAL